MLTLTQINMRVAVLISDRTDVRVRKFIRETEEHYIMLRGGQHSKMM